jgi:hypothetical protein
MPNCTRTLLHSLLLAVVGLAELMSPALAQTTVAQAQGFDPLALESAPVENIDTSSTTKVFAEGSFGNSSRRYGLGSTGLRRGSVDFLYSGRIGTRTKAFFSNRLDVVHPAALGNDSAMNSVREAYLSWQVGGDMTNIDVGRINVRAGPGYGYNPTDFFRDGGLRVLTSADPFALRQNRMGSVMVRAQRLWVDGSLAVALSPKLATRPSADGWSLDLGSTNNRDRGVVTLGSKLSESVNSQILLYKEDGLAPTLGANMTALLSDAATAHLEFTHGREPDLRSRILSLPATTVTRSRFVGGVTYTTLGKTSITAEYQYNGFGLDKTGWAALGAVPGTQLAYVGGALRLQELAQREAFLVYVTQKGLWLKDLDLTAYLRYNPVDNSRLAWLELRHHWVNFDLTLQYQRNLGRPDSEFGLLPDRRVIQVLGTYYF